MEVLCKICRKKIQRKLCDIKRSKYGYSFCSKKHAIKAVKLGIIETGKFNHRPLSINFHTGRARARKIFPMEPCEICKTLPSQRHHKDGNPMNNIKDNISFLCPKHHIYADRLPHLEHIASLGGKERAKSGKRDSKGRFVG